MNHLSIIDKLSQYTEKEITFKKYYNDGFYPPIDVTNENFDDNYWFDLHKRKAVVLIKHDRYGPEYTHSHQYFEGVFVLKGTCNQTVNKQSFQMNESDFLIISPSITHSIGVFDDSIVINVLIKKSTFKKFFYDFISIRNTLSEFFANNLFGTPQREYILFKEKKNEAIKNLILNMLHETESNDEHTDYMLNELVKMFFINLIRTPEEDIVFPSLKSESLSLKAKLIQYILENYNTVTLADIADHFHFSIPYTSKIIKNFVGMNFTKFITDIRLDKAKEYLSTSTLRIKDISELVGFQNPEHFMKLFKKTYKITPTEFRIKK